MLTINQDKELLKNFALKHEGINGFRYGYELYNTDSPVYPLMEVLPQGSSILKGVVSRKYLISISDLVNVDNSNEVQVLSDCELLCFDLPNYLRSVSNSGLLGTFKVDDSITLTDFTDKGKDVVSGQEFELTISSHIGSYSCNLPIESGNILDNNYIYVGGQTVSGNFLVEIKDQDGNVVQAFSTSGQYVITVLTGIQQVIGNTTTTITQNLI